MKSLQKLTHLRPLPEAVQEEVQTIERRSARGRERYLWRRRLRSFLLLCALSIPVAIGAFLVLRLRLVADGLVVTQPTVVSAPGQVRVVEVFVEPGAPCRLGQPLLRLESLTGQGERERLARQVEQRELRLALFDEGGRVDVTGRFEERDFAHDAAREAGLAQAALEVAEARLAGLSRTREVRAIALSQEQEERSGVVAQLRERLTAAQASIRAAESMVLPAEFEAESTASLRRSGVVPEHEISRSLADHRVAVHDVDRTSAMAAALGAELATAESTEALGEALREATLGELDASIDVLEREVAATRRQRDLWRETEELYRERRGDGRRTSTDVQRDYERRLLAAEVAEARAALLSFEETSGNVLLTAELDGVVDRLHVRIGTVVDEGAALLSYYDPTSLEVVAYAVPELSGRLAAGQACSLVVEGSGTDLDAEIVSIGAAWVSLPARLAPREIPGTDLRLPVVLGRDSQDGALRPGMRLRVVFSDPDPSLAGKLLARLGL